MEPSIPISVLIPVHNAEPYVEAAINSILRQTFGDFEIIAVDDGSTDSSRQILGKIAASDPRLRVISRPNTGIVGALNDGLAEANGEFIARMDADDIALPERFSKQINYLRSSPDCVAVGTAFVYMDDRGKLLKWNPRPLEHEEIEKCLLQGNGGAIIHPTVMMRRNAVDRVGGYRAAAQWIEDLDLYLRLARIGRLANLPEALLHYRYHEQSVNFTRNEGRLQRKISVMKEAYAERGLHFDETTWNSSTYSNKITSAAARDFAITSLRFCDPLTPWRYIFRAIRLEPFSKHNWKVLSYLIQKKAGFIRNQ